jgi:hypothetical protein
MRVRTVITGLAAAAICLAALWVQYYNFQPSQIVPGWLDSNRAAQIPNWISTAVLLFCGVVLFLFGWVAARWNWADRWQRSLQFGAGMGLLAGCLIFDFIGVFWSSIKGQAEILSNFYNPLSEAEGTRILIQAILQTGSLLYVNFVLVVLACILLGGLGGIVSTIVDRKDFWGSDPRNPEGWLFRLPGYLLTLSGFINLIISIAVLSLLHRRMLNTVAQFAEKYETQLDVRFSSQLFQFFSNLAAWLFAFLPFGITWGWTLRRWLVRKKVDVSSAFWILLTAACLWLVSWYIAPDTFRQPLNLLLLGFATLAGAFIGLLTRDRAEGFAYHLSDWVGYSLTYGILGGTQIVMGTLAYGLALALIGVVNIPHLTASGVVDKNPVDQVHSLYTIQSTSAALAILASIVVGLLFASLVSFLRTIFRVKDISSLPDESTG